MRVAFLVKFKRLHAFRRAYVMKMGSIQVDLVIYSISLQVAVDFPNNELFPSKMSWESTATCEQRRPYISLIFLLKNISLDEFISNSPS